MYFLKNFSYGVITSSLGSGITSVIVNPGHTLPTSLDTFVAIIWNPSVASDPSKDPNAEIVLGIYSSTNTYTITRAQESTSDVTHPAGSVIGLYITAGVLNSVSQVYPGAGVGVSLGSSWGTSLSYGTGANKLLQIGSDGKLPVIDGSKLTNLPSSGGSIPTGVAILTSSGTWTVPSGVTKAWVRVWGGGGAGGNANGHGVGNNGNASYFAGSSVTLAAYGGTGGIDGTGGGGAGGSAANGSINIAGGAGATAVAVYQTPFAGGFAPFSFPNGGATAYYNYNNFQSTITHFYGMGGAGHPNYGCGGGGGGYCEGMVDVSGSCAVTVGVGGTAPGGGYSGYAGENGLVIIYW